MNDAEEVLIVVRPQFSMCLLLCLAFSYPVNAQICPELPTKASPDASDRAFIDAWQQVAQPYSARYAVADGAEPDYGIGYLALDFSNGDWAGYYDWLLTIQLPLWQEPDPGSFYGWAHSGQVHPIAADSYPISGVGLVETEYELSNLIVLEAVGTGWYRIRLGAADDEPDLAVWTHSCHLGLGEHAMEFRAWEQFLIEHGDWLHFREQVTHTLREGPDLASDRVTLIGLDHKLELQEIVGDWMRVKVEQPDLSCLGEPRGSESETTIHEGWVKWRDENIGPWTWVYTRGC